MGKSNVYLFTEYSERIAMNWWGVAVVSKYVGTRY